MDTINRQHGRDRFVYCGWLRSELAPQAAVEVDVAMLLNPVEGHSDGVDLSALSVD